MWVFVGKLVDFLFIFFTGTDSLQGIRVQTCLKDVPELHAFGNGAQLQDHAKAPRGLTGVADADKVRKSCGQQ